MISSVLRVSNDNTSFETAMIIRLELPGISDTPTTFFWRVTKLLGKKNLKIISKACGTLMTN